MTKYEDKKVGRPPAGEEREDLRKVTFKADPETWAAIKSLEAAAKQAGVVAPRSVAIRRALIEAAGRLPAPAGRRGGR